MNEKSNDTSKILVIGRECKYADLSVGWKDAFPYLCDYDFVIVDTTSLTEEVLDSILEDGDADKFEKASKELYEGMMASMMVICVSSPTIYNSSFFEDKLISNYHWFPADISFISAKGTRMETTGKKYYDDDYLKLIKSYDCYYEKGNLARVRPLYRAKVKTEVYSFMVNAVKKPLLFGLLFSEYNPPPTTYRSYKPPESPVVSNPIIFLPKPTTVSLSEGINQIVRNLKNAPDKKDEQEDIPEWADKLLIANESILVGEKKEKEKQISEQQTQILEIDRSLNQLRRYKKLLYSTGKLLERVVLESFGLLGIKAEAVLGFQQDGNLYLGDFTLPLEIKGREGSIQEGDVMQAAKRVPTDLYNDGRKGSYAILFGNPHRLDTPFSKKRAPTFEPSVILLATTNGIGLLSSEDLFSLVERKLKGENIDPDELIENLKSRGLIKFKKD